MPSTVLYMYVHRLNLADFWADKFVLRSGCKRVAQMVDLALEDEPEEEEEEEEDGIEELAINLTIV